MSNKHIYLAIILLLIWFWATVTGMVWFFVSE